MTSVASIAMGRHLRRAKGNVELHESGEKRAHRSISGECSGRSSSVRSSSSTARTSFS